MAKKVNKKVKEVTSSTEKLIKDADQVILVTATNGHVEVIGVKSVNYAHDAKGLLVGALDSYANRSTLNAINALNKNIMKYVDDIVKGK